MKKKHWVVTGKIYGEKTKRIEKFEICSTDNEKSDSFKKDRAKALIQKIDVKETTNES